MRERLDHGRSTGDAKEHFVSTLEVMMKEKEYEIVENVFFPG